MIAAHAVGVERDTARAVIEANHYTKSVPSGKSVYILYGPVIVVFSIPANKNISRWLLGRDNVVWELSRLWAPDSHAPNLLTQALCATTRLFRTMHPEVEALVSYADPNVGHLGGVYRAASWKHLGQCEENRAYRSASGAVVSRRAFHSGKKALRRAEIEALGFVQLKLPGKHRFAKGLTRRAKKQIASR